MRGKNRKSLPPGERPRNKSQEAKGPAKQLPDFKRDIRYEYEPTPEMLAKVVKSYERRMKRRREKRHKYLQNAQFPERDEQM